MQGLSAPPAPAGRQPSAAYRWRPQASRRPSGAACPAGRRAPRPAAPSPPAPAPIASYSGLMRIGLMSGRRAPRPAAPSPPAPAPGALDLGFMSVGCHVRASHATPPPRQLCQHLHQERRHQARLRWHGDLNRQCERRLISKCLPTPPRGMHLCHSSCMSISWPVTSRP